jgi:phosphatidylserine/phosphatidylglycerophosphate/cardiolipin synthase-like enzyme
MPALFSPIANPATWSFSYVSKTLPDGLRYSGYTVRGVSASIASNENVRLPGLSILKKVTGTDGLVYVECQLNPFPIRQIATQLAFGLPTFYLVFNDASGLSFNDDEMGNGGFNLKSTTSVVIAMMGQDRIVIDPVEWARQINEVLSDKSDWQPFYNAINTTLNTGNDAPVLLLDQTGSPLQTVSVGIVYGSPGSETVHTAVMNSADEGNLQATVQRLHAADASSMPIGNLWSTATSFRLRPTQTDSDDDFQMVRLEDQTTATDEIEVTPANRHVMFINLRQWFSKQCAVPSGASSPALANYTRGNLVTPLVNGPAFFDDLFRELHDAAQISNGGYHLAGWAMVHDKEMTKKKDGDPGNLPLTLKAAAELIGAAGGGCRFLPAKFIHLAPGTSVDDAEIIIFYSIVSGILMLNAFGVDFARTDEAGVIILAILIMANAAVVSHIINTGGEGLEPNKDAATELNSVTNSTSLLSPYPAHVDDNTLSPDTSDFPFDVIFDVIRNFGIYHQKMSVLKNSKGYMAYLGGIDINTDRLDDEHHLAKGPYHDVHAKVTGPAVLDVAQSFEERWQQESTDDLVFDVTDISGLGTPGQDIVQIARTYFAASTPGRQLDFAPNGDRTILNTILKAINNAKEFIYIEDQYLTPPQEYRDALISKVTSGEIKKLIIAIPGTNDQPFGEVVRVPFISALKSADPGNVVQVGYPRRHYTVSDNDTRSSSGKLTLMMDMPNTSGSPAAIALAPKSRLPKPPFWVAVEGEMMYVYDEDAMTTSPDPATTLVYKALRGADTHLVAGGSSPKGTSIRAHKKGAAATVIHHAGIYVHAKLMIVDDVFLSVGSANLNRRGFYHDGEINLFTIPEALRFHAANPIAKLRRQLWAEMLNLPKEMAAPLMSDPLAAAELFSRSPFLGNRFADIEAIPTNLMAMTSFSGGDGLVGALIQLFYTTVASINFQKLFDGVVDPSSSTETLDCS